MKTKAELLEQYLNSAKEVDELEEMIAKLEDRIDTFDRVIERNEKLVEHPETDKSIETYVIARNQCDLDRINLSLRKNKLEKEMLEFELAAAEAE